MGTSTRWIALGLMSFATIGCAERVPVNTADSSPPTNLTLSTGGRDGGELTVTSGDIEGTWAKTESISILSQATDPDGVKDVELWMTGERWCTTADGLETHEGPGLVSDPVATFVELASDGLAPKTALVSHVIEAKDVLERSCELGSRIRHTFWAKTHNFGGQELSTSGRLNLDYVYPPAP